MNESHVQCPKCQARYKVPAGFAKESVACKKCGATIPVSAAPARTESPASAPIRTARAGSSRSASRTPARGAAAVSTSARGGSRGSARDRRGRDGDSEKKSKTGLYVALGAGGLAVAGIVIWLVLSSGGNDAPPVVPAASPEETSTADSGSPAPPPAAAPASIPPPSSGGSSAADAGDSLMQKGESLFGETPGKKKRFPVEKLAHLDDTTPEMQSRIDDNLTKLLDVNNPKQGNEARNDLVKVGKPAIPRLLSSWVDLKMDDEADVTRANMIHQTLGEITGKEITFSPDNATSPSDAKLREKVLGSWFLWWGQNRDSFVRRSNTE